MRRLHRLSFAIFTIIFIYLASTFIAQAQNQPGVICYDWHSINPNSRAAVQGVISDAEYAQIWRFVGRADTGVQLRLEVLDGSLEPFIYVTNEATGNRILSTSSNYGEDGRDIFLPFTPPNDSTYSITVSRLGEQDGHSRGAYRLTIEQVPTTTRRTESDMKQHAYIFDGEIVHDSIYAAQQYHLWYFSGIAGQMINVRLVATGDTELVQNQHFVRLWWFNVGSNRWEGGRGDFTTNDGLNISAVNVRLDQTGDWIIAVHAEDSPIPAFDLSITGILTTRPDPMLCGDPPPQCPEPNLLDATAVTVLNNVPQTGSVSGATPIVAYQFAALQGNVVSIDMQRISGELDTYLGLLDSTGGVIAFDDSTDPASSRITDYPITANGCYTIYASREGVYDGTTEGSFMLTVTGIPQEAPDVIPFPPDVIAGGDIERGESKSGAITASDPRMAFRFTGDGGAVTINAARTSGTLRPALQLLDQDGNVLAEVGVTFAGSASNPLTFTAEDGATYFIVVQRLGGADGNTEGEFSVTVSG